MDKQKRSLSVIVTAMNEEGNLRPTIESVLSAIDIPTFDSEVIIINDGSRDRTGAIADELAAQNPCIRVHHHPRNLGLDRAYLKGIELATKEYVGWVAGNNIIPAEALHEIYGRIGEADVVFSYPVVDIRRKRRRWLSRAFVQILNLLFGARLRYYTGPCVYRTDVAKSLRIITKGSMIIPEIVLRLIEHGQTYIEVSLKPKPRTAGKTKTFRIANIVYVASSVLRLFVDIRLRSKSHRRPAAQVAVDRRHEERRREER